MPANDPNAISFDALLMVNGGCLVSPDADTTPSFDSPVIDIL
jgi:hypothetical protein